MANPFPQLQLQPGSGLSFPWAEKVSGVMGDFDASFGADGVSYGMTIYINWVDLATACQELLGYSYREGVWPPSGSGRLCRIPPWQHPKFNQLYVKRISSIKGVRLEGKLHAEQLLLGGIGAGFAVTAPVTTFNKAILTLQFHRPPYFVRTDQDVTAANGQQYEWLRWVDKKWSINTQMLVRENATFEFCSDQGIDLAFKEFQGSIGQKINHIKVSRTWHEIPEACIFEPTMIELAGGVDITPQGIPRNLLYTQTPTLNPITGFRQLAGASIGGCVNSPIGGGVLDDDADAQLRFFGAHMGTLLLESIELTPKPLQLPAILMKIPGWAKNEPISQTQYDVTFHFDLFDPPRAPQISENDNIIVGTGARVSQAYRGHNLAPWAGDGFWYGVQSKQVVNGLGAITGGLITAGKRSTPFQYACFEDLFVVL